MRKLIPGLLAVVGLSCMFGAIRSVHAQGSERFQKVFPFEGFKNYPADEQVKACKGRYENATARMRLLQFDGETLIAIRVRNMPPNALLTIWLKLAQPSPLTGAGVTALANPDDIEALAAITPSSSLTEAAKDIGLKGDDGSGGTLAANAFRTDQRGNGYFIAYLKFPLIKGAYQFCEFDDTLAPMANDNVPFTLRIAAHCTDNKAHGLIAGKHEPFFDWGW